MKRFHPVVVVSALAACCVLMQTSVLAAGPVDKFKRGLAGIMFGGIEVPATLCEESRNQGWVWGVSVGFFKSVGNFAAREVTGVFEFVTAPIPWPDDQYNPYMDTAYPWDRFNTPKDTSVVPGPPEILPGAASAAPQASTPAAAPSAPATTPVSASATPQTPPASK
jgi:putative exosortase-associated protein (TIGR04073 family)